MKKKILIFSAAGILAIAGLAYGFTSSKKGCPLEGTPSCPKVNCPLAGTPDCPFDKTTNAALPDCCRE
jgi:hypothetical protein